MPLPDVSDHLVPVHRLSQFVAGSIVLWGAIPARTVRQRVGLGPGPMRGQETQARRAAGREWYLRAGGKIMK